MSQVKRNLDRTSGEEGQAAISIVLILGMFLLAMLGFAVDLTNMWFHRQAGRAAADSACQAAAMDILAGSPSSTSGFTVGQAGDCVGSPRATMCAYAAANGYNGAGLSSTAESNSVSWTYPGSVPGVSSAGSSFLKVNIAENVRTYFMSLLLPSHFQTLNVACTCGVIQVKEPAPMLVLNPTISGAFTYSGGGGVVIAGGPARSVQVNSSSATAVKWTASGMIDLSAGGPKGTGSDIGIVGGPDTFPANYGTTTQCNGNSGYCGGSTGTWKGGVLPIADPYGAVPAPAAQANAPAPTWVQYGVNGCPDKTQVYQYYNPQTQQSVYASCPEYSPGNYPSGINISGTTTAIFDPGIYYMNGSLNVSGSATVRMAKPSGYQHTDGVMFYFQSGAMNLSGASGNPNSNVDNISTNDLTCDGSAPPASLGMPSTIGGNILWGQCTANGTYWDSQGDTTDSRGAPGTRSLLIFQAHSNTTQTALSGSGQLSFSGTIYLHSNSGADVFNLSGGTATGTFILGEIVADQVQLSGSGAVRLALTPAAIINMSKAAILQ